MKPKLEPKRKKTPPKDWMERKAKGQLPHSPGEAFFRKHGRMPGRADRVEA